MMQFFNISVGARSVPCRPVHRLFVFTLLVLFACQSEKNKWRILHAVTVGQAHYYLQ